jgi:hypothetical protein
LAILGRLIGVIGREPVDVVGVWVFSLAFFNWDYKCNN